MYRGISNCHFHHFYMLYQVADPKPLQLNTKYYVNQLCHTLSPNPKNKCTPLLYPTLYPNGVHILLYPTLYSKYAPLWTMYPTFIPHFVPHWGTYFLVPHFYMLFTFQKHYFVSMVISLLSIWWSWKGPWFKLYTLLYI